MRPKMPTISNCADGETWSLMDSNASKVCPLKMPAQRLHNNNLQHLWSMAGLTNLRQGIDRRTPFPDAPEYGQQPDTPVGKHPKGGARDGLPPHLVLMHQRGTPNAMAAACRTLDAGSFESL